MGRGDIPVVDLGDRGHGDQLGGDGLGHRRRLGQGVVRSLGARQAKAREGDGPGPGIGAGEGAGGGTRREGDLADIRGNNTHQGRAAGIHRRDRVPVIDLVRRGDPADGQGCTVDRAAPGRRGRQDVVGQEGGPGRRIVGRRQGHRHRPPGVGIARICRIVGPGGLGDRGAFAGDPSADGVVGRGEGRRRVPVVGLGRVTGDGGQQAPRIDRPDGVGARRPRRRDIVPAVGTAEGDGGDGNIQSGRHVLAGEARPGRRGDGHRIAGENARQGVGRAGRGQDRRPVVGLDHACNCQGTGEGRDVGSEAGRLNQAVVARVGTGNGVTADRDRLVVPDILGVEQARGGHVVEVHRIAGEQTGPDDRGGVVDLGDAGGVVDPADRRWPREGQGRRRDDADGAVGQGGGDRIVRRPGAREGDAGKVDQLVRPHRLGVEGPGNRRPVHGHGRQVGGLDARQGVGRARYRSLAVVDPLDPDQGQELGIDLAHAGSTGREDVVAGQGRSGGGEVGRRQQGGYRPASGIGEIIGPRRLGHREGVGPDQPCDRIVGRGQAGCRGGVIGLGRVADDRDRQALGADRPRARGGGG